MATNNLAASFEEALSTIDRDGASGPLITNMMAKCRKLLEGTAKKGAYPTAKLFGNWALHTELTTDKAAIAILEEVNDFVVGLIHGKGGGPFGTEITRRLKLDDLRAELLAICKGIQRSGTRACRRCVVGSHSGQIAQRIVCEPHHGDG